MRKRSSKKPEDTPAPEQADEQAAQEQQPGTTPTEGEKNPAAVALGRLGGLKGGVARAAKLTTEQRRAIAKKAAEARWRKDQSSSK